MSGNFGRYSYQKNKWITQVRPHQGAMVNADDGVENAQVQLRNTATIGDFAIGSGAPHDHGVLEWDERVQIGVAPNIHRLIPGFVIADGHWGEVRLRDGETLDENRPLDLISKQADFMSADAADNGSYAVICDIWDRYVGATEDPRLIDTAYGAITSSRMQRMAQLKLIRMRDSSHAELKNTIENRLPPFGDLRLREVNLLQDSIVTDECDPCAGSINLEDDDFDNCHFRVEIHESNFDQVSAQGDELVRNAAEGFGIVIKFSRENGSIELPARDRDLILNDPNYAGAAFEIFSLESEQQFGVAHIVAQPRSNQILDRSGLAGLSEAILDDRYIRIWDGAATLDFSRDDLNPSVVGSNNVVGSMDTGSDTLRFTLRVMEYELVFDSEASPSDTTIFAGDSFSIEKRGFAEDTANRIFFHQEPVSTHHSYAFLGSVFNGQFLELGDSDIRSLHFQKVTAIEGLDVSWSNRYHPEIESNTVQDAIDLLFGQNGDDCCCEYCINPEIEIVPQLEQIIEQVQARERLSAVICIPSGTHILQQPVELGGFENLTIKGTGATHCSLVFHAGAALEFSKFESVRLQGIAFEQGDNEMPDTGMVNLQEVQNVTVDACHFRNVHSNASTFEVKPLLNLQNQELIAGSEADIGHCHFSTSRYLTALQISNFADKRIYHNQFSGRDFGQRYILSNIPVTFEGTVEPGPDVEDEVFELISNSRVEDEPDDVDPVRGNIREIIERRVVVPGTDVQTIDAARNLLVNNMLRSGRDLTNRREFEAAFNDATIMARSSRSPTAQPRRTADRAPATISDAQRDAVREELGGGLDILNIDELVIAGGGSLPPILRDPDWIDAADVEPTVVANGQAGIIIRDPQSAQTRIYDNRFDQVDYPVYVIGQERPISADEILGDESLVAVERNQITRTGRTFIHQIRIGQFWIRAPIWLQNTGQQIVTDNKIRHSFDRPALQEQFHRIFIEFLFGKASLPSLETAIEITASTANSNGSVLRACDNDALYFRSAVRVSNSPKHRGAQEAEIMRPNIWILRTNTCVPARNMWRPVDFVPNQQAVLENDNIRIVF